MTGIRDNQKHRILLVDDHELVREHLKELLAREADLSVCAEAEDAPTALDLIKKEQPDLVILDLSLKESHGLQLLEGVRPLQPKIRVLVLSMHDEVMFVQRALQEGAMGYITKEEASVDILSAIRTVLNDRMFLSESMSAKLGEKRERSLGAEGLGGPG